MISSTLMRKVNECIKTTILPNGLKIVRVKHPKSSLYLVNIQVNLGSGSTNFLNKDQIQSILPGTAHFLEHLAFWNHEKNIYEDFFNNQAILNAYTSLSMTNYMFTTQKVNLEQNIFYLVNHLLAPRFTESNVEYEKLVIKSEIELANTNHETSELYSILEKLYPNHSVGVIPTGTVEDINGFSSEYLIEIYSRFYTTDNMVIYIVGGEGDVDYSLLGNLGKPENESFYPSLGVDFNKLVFQKNDNEITFGLRLNIANKKELLIKEIEWKLFEKVISDNESPFFKLISKNRETEVTSSKIISQFHPTGSFIITTLKGKGLEHISSLYPNLSDDSLLSELVYFGKKTFLEELIYNFDYTRNVFEWVQKCLEADSKLSDIYEIANNWSIRSLKDMLRNLYGEQRVVR